MEKTLECCGQKPRRSFIQTSYRDDEGFYELKCRKCGLRVRVENNWRGTSTVEQLAVTNWNANPFRKVKEDNHDG